MICVRGLTVNLVNPADYFIRDLLWNYGVVYCDDISYPESFLYMVMRMKSILRVVVSHDTRDDNPIDPELVSGFILFGIITTQNNSLRRSVIMDKVEEVLGTFDEKGMDREVVNRERGVAVYDHLSFYLTSLKNLCYNIA